MAGMMKRAPLTALRVGWPVPFLIAYVVFITGPALGSDFSVLDDHMVPLYLGPDGIISWGETLGAIRAESLTWANRFLPMHFTLRVIEIKWRGFDAWGAHGEGFRPLSQLRHRDGACIGAAFSGAAGMPCRYLVNFSGARY